MSTRGWLLFALMCVIWGVPYLLIRVAVRDFSPAALVLARTGGAALLLVPIAAARGELRPAFDRILPVSLFALVELAIPWGLLSSAETRITSSLAGLLVAAVPLVGALIARLSGASERIGPIGLFGLLLGLGGVAALVGLDLGAVDARALAEVAVVVVGYALGPAILSRSLAGVPALGVITISLAETAVVYVPLTLLSRASKAPTTHALAAVAVLIVVCTALAFLLFFALIAEIGPVRATVITYVNPAVAVALGVGLLGEHFSAGMAVGFVLVLAGSLLATRSRASAPSGLRLASDEAV